MSQALLSVCLITYNHVKYIRQAIEGVLKQQVNFTWELIIADDCSTDGTRDIVLEFKDRYPDFIKLILQKQNVGPAQNWMNLLSTPNSKYIAYFEGDDYWTDRLKLQKQFDILESDNGLSACIHYCKVLKNDTIIDSKKKYTKEIIGVEDIIKEWNVHSCTIMYRNFNIPNWVFKVNAGDQGLLLACSLRGKIFNIMENLAVYRRHEGSITHKNPEYLGVNLNVNVIDLLKVVKKITRRRYESIINTRINSNCRSIIFSSKGLLFKLKYYWMYLATSNYRSKEDRAAVIRTSQKFLKQSLI